MSENGNKRTSLFARRVRLFLFGRHFRCALVSSLMLCCVHVSAGEYDSVLQAILSRLDTIEDYSELSSDSVYSFIQPDVYKILTRTYSIDVGITNLANILTRYPWDYAHVGHSKNGGLLRGVWDIDQSLFALTNGLAPYFPNAEKGGLIYGPNDSWGFLWYSGEENNVTDSHLEFESLTLGQNVDVNVVNDPYFGGDANNPLYIERAFNRAFNTTGLNGFGAVGYGFWNVWQAEAWRRQLGALGAVTNTWATFTNSPALASLQGVFADEEFRKTYQASNFAYEVVNQSGMNYDEGTNNISLSMGIEGQLPKLGFDLYGTDVVSVAEIGDTLTNRSVLVSAEDFAVPNGLGGWLFRVGKNNDVTYQHGVFEVDLNGSAFAQWAENFPRWIELLCDIVFYAFSLVLYIKTGLYYMDKIAD